MGNEEFSCVITCVPQGIVLWWEHLEYLVVYYGILDGRHTFVNSRGNNLPMYQRAKYIFTGRYATPEETIEYWMTRKQWEIYRAEVA